MDIRDRVRRNARTDAEQASATKQLAVLSRMLDEAETRALEKEAAKKVKPTMSRQEEQVERLAKVITDELVKQTQRSTLGLRLLDRIHDRLPGQAAPRVTANVRPAPAAAGRGLSLKDRLR